MLWQGRRQSSNIEDRRGMGGGMRFPGGFGGGGFGGGRIRGGGLGIGGIIILFIIAWALGINPLALLSGDPGSGGYVEQQPDQTAGGAISNPQQEGQKDFVSVVLADTEDTWHQLLPKIGVQY